MTSLTVLLFLVGIGAGFVSGIVGGGSGLILVPLLILLGLDPNIATTTTLFGFVGVSIGSIVRFRREADLRADYALPLTLIALLSGFAGPFLHFAFSNEVFQRTVGGLVLICIPFFLAKRRLRLSRAESASFSPKPLAGHTACAFIFILQTAFGSGTGILAIFSLVHFFGLSVLQSNAVLRFPSLFSSLTALVVYATHGAVHYGLGLTLLVATGLGGYLGTHAAIKGGEKLALYAFASFAAVVATLLLIR